MFNAVLMIPVSELADMMQDEELVLELEEGTTETCAYPVLVSNKTYDADDNSPNARISRWMSENLGLNETTVYVEVEA